MIGSLCASTTASAQSTELDRPTRLTSTETKAFVDRDVTHYYVLDAGPGEISIAMAVNHLMTYWKILGPDLNPVAGDNLHASAEDQKITRLNLLRKVSLILKVENTAYTTGAGFYRFRLGGAVDLGGGEPWLSGIPHEGILSIKMKDGSTKEIDLTQVTGLRIK